MTSFFDLLKKGETELSDIAENPYWESKIILLDVFNLEKPALFANLAKKCTNAKKLTHFLKLIRKRKEGCPLAYILKSSFFRNHEYYLERGVLIPRPETSLLIDKTIEKIEALGLKDTAFTIFELGFGSGIISIELALKFPKAQIYAWDVSPKAYKIANINAKRFRVSNITFINKDFFKDLAYFYSRKECAKHCVFISNPPYVAESDFHILDNGIKNFEPKKALISGKYGLTVYRRLFAVLKDFKGLIALEIGINQKNILEELLLKTGFGNFVFFKDEGKLDRVLLVT